MANFAILNKDDNAGIPLKRPEVSPSEALPEIARAIDRSKLPRASSIEKMSPEEIANSINDLFLIDGIFLGGGKKTSAVKVGEKTYNLYLPNSKVVEAMKSVTKGSTVQWVGVLQFHKKELEFEINNPKMIPPRSSGNHLPKKKPAQWRVFLWPRQMWFYYSSFFFVT